MKPAQPTDNKYSIGQAAKIVDVSTDTLRFYEKKGLLPDISKTPAGYRMYSKSDIRRIAFIKQAQAHALSLSDIKEILDMKETNFQSCKAVHDLMINKKEAIQKKLNGLAAVSKGLEEWIYACEQGGDLPVENCPILKSLDETDEQSC